ncbi:hypothetical protein [Larkinella terrae]|uniref:Uncharacterized protein n=1 Tax=Larkinella terrae TaxID=2025311 RepID=A0A7K0EER2_9BACT|nr:hypothetical protein [Larkinella terrae]MRS60323.1 hypothetical protein [Larkinella terrae]
MSKLNHPTEGSSLRFRLCLLLMAGIGIASWLRPASSGSKPPATAAKTTEAFTPVQQENRNFYGAIGSLAELMFGTPAQRKSAYDEEERARRDSDAALDERLGREREERYKQEAEERYQDHQDYLQQQKEQNDQYYEQKKAEESTY